MSRMCRGLDFISLGLVLFKSMRSSTRQMLLTSLLLCTFYLANDDDPDIAIICPATSRDHFTEARIGDCEGDVRLLWLKNRDFCISLPLACGTTTRLNSQRPYSFIVHPPEISPTHNKYAKGYRILLTLR